MPDRPLAGPTADLDLAGLHTSLEDPALASMTFLNEVTGRHPKALSFAPGRPTEEGFDVEAVHRYLRRFCDHLATDRGHTPEEVRRTLCQYGRTSGIVHELIARQLEVDEGLRTEPESIVVTVGCQEAMYLVLRALRRDEHDVVLAVSPTYVGLTGAARLVDMPVLPVASGSTGIDLADLTAQVRGARERGLRPRACYLVPDFANPSGLSLDLATRRELLALAEREGILLLEDNPYGMFHDGSGRVPTLKALDTGRRVIHLGSFAKTVLPGARVGYVVADQRVGDGQGRIQGLAEHLSRIKSMLTVNTSPISQAVVGGALLENDFSLERATSRSRHVYQRNLAHVLRGLETRFGRCDSVSWNTPRGGFFIVVTVPFTVDDELLERSGRSFGVLWTPVSHFYDGKGGRNQIRLSCSSLDSAQVEEGLNRLANLFVDKGVLGVDTGTDSMPGCSSVSM
ncbi:PLP-dependent aminotransferase family protein [Streptomyces canus]|uniref:aminotransferase-like domain-containing protein n=1 Tax=Streptomyces canus TaxID=58343 RepID=UPI00037D7E5C|nr:PLP-dependent aminotransferase family protein [Streptomyces canus]